ncbi:MAG: thioredoxin-dependent thiol peroxidase [Bacillota bacterium]|jgi:peroxiredoxin Q/BCP
MLENGTAAPAFALPDQDGTIVSSEELKGKKYILYFYPKDNTAGCAKQAAAFRDAKEELAALGVTVFGVSKDSAASHRRFIEKQSLNFTLLADTELEVIKAYDVWQEKKNYGKVSMGVVRTAYLIDENGVIEMAWPKIKAADSAAIVLDYLKK